MFLYGLHRQEICNPEDCQCLPTNLSAIFFSVFFCLAHVSNDFSPHVILQVESPVSVFCPYFDLLWVCFGNTADLASLSEFISLLFTPSFRLLRILPRRNLFNFSLAISSFFTPSLIIFKLLVLLKKWVPVIWQHWCCSQITLIFQIQSVMWNQKEPVVQVQLWETIAPTNEAWCVSYLLLHNK